LLAELCATGLLIKLAQSTPTNPTPVNPKSANPKSNNERRQARLANVSPPIYTFKSGLSNQSLEISTFK